MNEKKLIYVTEKLLAVELFAKELREELNEMFKEGATEVKVSEVTVIANKVNVESAPQTPNIKVEPKKEVAPEPTPEPTPAPVEEPEDEEIDPVDAIISEYGLLELSADELKEYLDGYKIKYTKKLSSVEKLARIVAEAIVDGRIPTEPTEEDTDSESEEDAGDAGVAEEAESRNGEAEEVSEGTDDNLSSEVDFVPSPERAKAEKEIEMDIKSKLFNKKLKLSAIKNFLKEYYDGDADCADCKGCSEEETIECYIDIQKSLVDDDGEVMKPEEGYFRNDVLHCCGKECVQDPDDEALVYCEICASQYEI